MDAREELSRLVDAACGTRLHLVDGAATRSVDSGQAENVDRRTGIEANRLPGALGRQPFDAARLSRPRWRVLVDPLASMIAIDSRGREIAQPASAAQSVR